MISQKEIDPNRMRVFGASFGGFAVLSFITRLPQYNWKAAVDIVGPRSKSIDVEHMVFEDEGHGFTEYSNLVRALKRSAEFLVKKLS